MAGELEGAPEDGELERAPEDEDGEEDFGSDLELPGQFLERAVDAYNQHSADNLEAVKVQAEVRRFEIEQQSDQHRRTLQTTENLANLKKQERDADRTAETGQWTTAARYGAVGLALVCLLIGFLANLGDTETARLFITNATTLIAASMGGYFKGKDDGRKEQDGQVPA